MDLYLIRHAEAVSRESPEFKDADRPLTEAGRVQSIRLGEFFRRRQIALGAIVSSPLVRAKQTTEWFLSGWAESRPDVVVLDEIGHEMRAKKVARFLERLNKTCLAVVGHEPTLSEFTSWLIGSRKAQLELAKGGFAWVSCSAVAKGAGTLRGLVSPDWIG